MLVKCHFFVIKLIYLPTEIAWILGLEQNFTSLMYV